MLDGVEPDVIEQIRHAAEHVPGIHLEQTRARWIGHRLHADITVSFDQNVSVGEATSLTDSLRAVLRDHFQALEDWLLRETSVTQVSTSP